MTILDIIVRETNITFRKVTANEYAGPCPFCQTGDDRFRLWLQKGRYWCRVCGRSGDAIQFLRDHNKMSYREACAYLRQQPGNGYFSPLNAQPARTLPQTPPSASWQGPAYDFVLDCAHRLMGSNEGTRARSWLNKRTLTVETLNTYCIGYNPTDQYIERSVWDLPPQQDDKGRNKKLWLPRGIVIPCWVDGELWGIRIRRPIGKPKYYWLPGGTPALYNADAITLNQPAVLLEGEIDALTNTQVADDLAAPVATGSTHGARRMIWLARLATANTVLVAYDADEEGEKASTYWLKALPNARRWRPYWGDVNGMAQDGVDVRSWLLAGLTYFSNSK